MSIITFISVILGGLHLIHVGSAADVSVALTTCQPDEIVLAVTNRGGRPATLGRPQFEIHSPAANGPLRVPSFLEKDPFDNHADLAGDEHDVIPYNHPVAPFFGPEDLEGGACRIHVKLAVTPESGQHPFVENDCTCGSQN